MRGKTVVMALVWVLVAAAAGCNPRTVVRKSPGPGSCGVRYYRPKPCLFVAPYTTLEAEHDAGATIAKGPAPSDQFVTIQLQYLPDFGEEYSIEVKPGLGRANVSIKLEDGWNLTSINQELDSRFAENVKAVADLLEAVAPQGMIPGPDAPGSQSMGQAKAVVRATNVPIGYYEAVLGQGPCGQKQIFGWRYLGFAPYAACPLAGCGRETVPCAMLELYGLVFDNGIMTFKPLAGIHGIGQSGGFVHARQADRGPETPWHYPGGDALDAAPQRLPLAESGS